MMKTPDLWPLGPVLCLRREGIRRERPDSDVGLLVLHPEIRRTEVFLLNVYDERVGRLLSGDVSGIDSVIYADFQAIYDDGWRVD
jgi:hypothetical protein